MAELVVCVGAAYAAAVTFKAHVWGVSEVQGFSQPTPQLSDKNYAARLAGFFGGRHAIIMLVFTLIAVDQGGF